MRIVFKRLRDNGINLKPKKCELFRNQVKYLGHIVSCEGYKTDPSNTHALTVLKEQQPKAVGDVHRILGLFKYYSKYIPNFSQIAIPLFDLLQQPKETNNNNRTNENRKRNGHTLEMSRCTERTSRGGLQFNALNTICVIESNW